MIFLIAKSRDYFTESWMYICMLAWLLENDKIIEIHADGTFKTDQKKPENPPATVATSRRELFTSFAGRARTEVESAMKQLFSFIY